MILPICYLAVSAVIKPYSPEIVDNSRAEEVLIEHELSYESTDGQDFAKIYDLKQEEDSSDPMKQEDRKTRRVDLYIEDKRRSDCPRSRAWTTWVIQPREEPSIRSNNQEQRRIWRKQARMNTLAQRARMQGRI
jgi:hypothetical protein